MIPSSIQDIFGTLSVAILAAVVVLLLWWIYEQGSGKFSAWVRQRFFDPPPDASVLVVLFLLLYGFGIIVENLTDHLTDSEKEYELTGFNYTSIRDFVPMIQSEILKSEGHHRFVTIFRKCDEEPLDGCELGSLGREYFGEHRSFLAGLAGRNEKFQLFVKDPIRYLEGKAPDTPTSFKERKKVAVAFVNKLYYTSKNWAYELDTHYDELQSIQRHIEYTRSSFLIATWGIILAWLSLAASRLRHREHAAGQPYPWGTQLRRTVRGTLVLVFIAAVGRMGYGHTEINFNERALGYHVSFLQREHVAEQREHVAEEAPTLHGLLANQWVQTSAEYTALSLQTYNLARRVVEDTLKTTPIGNERCPAGVVDLDRQSPCPAVILDLDETVIDNGPFQGYLMREGLSFSPPLWDEWIRDGITLVEPIPGSLEFIGKMRDLGVTVIYISNRPDTTLERKATIEALEHLGVDTTGLEDPRTHRLLLKSEKSSSKDARRRSVEQKYKVIALIGDSLGDFAGVFDPGQDTTIDGRREKAMEAREKWGREWLVLPNPTYGAWQRLLDGEKPFDSLKIWKRKATQF